MIDYAPELVQGLKTVLPTYVEPVESTTKVPCITYTETNRKDIHAVNGAQYQEIQVRIRVWAADRSSLDRYADRVEAVMRRLGWTISGGGDLAANGRCCRVMVCTAIGYDQKSW